MSPFFNRFPANDLATFFKLLDNDESFAPGHGTRGHIASFTPKFDIHEDKEAYHVSGEIPGIEQKNINIEFTDHSTLVISGRTHHEHQEGGEPTPTNGSESSKPKVKSPTVEDGDDDEAAKDGSSTPKDQVAVTKNDQTKQVAKQQGPQHNYIIRERSVGEFRRSFTFPGKVDQDGVKANLKNGILNIVVPKATFAKRTVTIE